MSHQQTRTARHGADSRGTVGGWLRGWPVHSRPWLAAGAAAFVASLLTWVVDDHRRDIAVEQIYRCAYFDGVQAAHRESDGEQAVTSSLRAQ